ncbi:MAG: protein kinase [Planctomycetes bacterium]|nr:protein kinase [Planctomycetota bacterium]
METLYCSCGKGLDVAPGSSVKCPACGRVTDVPFNPSDSVPAPLSRDKESRFGAIAARLGLVMPDQLRQAVEEQSSALARGRRVRLGEILVERGWMKGDDARRVLELQNKQIFECPGCRRRYNVANLPAGGRLECPRCATAVASPDRSGNLRVDESFYMQGASESGPPPPGLPAEVRDRIPGYRIERVLGKGGMGTVYLATQLSLSRSVAVKILSPRLASDDSYVNRFLNEAKSIASLRHENIIAAIDRGMAWPYYFLVMEYAEGETVAARLARDRTIPEREAVSLARQVAEGLRHAEQQGFLHRDIKPANLIVSSEGRVKICDLGISKSIRDDPPSTRDGFRPEPAPAAPPRAEREARSRVEGEPEQILCSPSYASPEAVQGKALDLRSDIYSLGATLYEMLTGSPMFPGDDRAEVVRRQIEDEPVPPRKLNAALSEGIQRILLKMLSKDLEKRHSSYDQLIGELETLVNVRPPTRIVHPPRRRFARLFRRSGNPTLILVLLVAGLIVAAIVLAVRHRTAGSGEAASPPKPAVTK